MTPNVMPDLIGHLVLAAGKRLPVGAGNDEKKEPAMTKKTGPDSRTGLFYVSQDYLTTQMATRFSSGVG